MQNPLIFIKSVIRRVPDLVFPNLAWSFYPEHLYGKGISFIEKLRKAIRSPLIALDFFSRLLYVRLFLLVGYIGLVLMFMRKKYIEVLILIAIVCSSWNIVISHIEYRYLTPFYSVFSFFVGYAIMYFLSRGKRTL